MTRDELKARLNGVTVPMITPMSDDEDLCEAGTRQFTRFLIENGVAGVYPASGCGEVWKLSGDERQRMMDIVLDEAEGRALVIPGTGGGSTREAIVMTEYARDRGADAVVVWPPYFMGTAYNDDAIFNHFESIAHAVDVPTIVYDAPEITGYPLSHDLVDRLADIDAVVGIKDSTGDMDGFVRRLERVGERISVLQGWDSLLLASLATGSSGAILSSANVCPRLVVEIVEAFRRGDLVQARTQHAQLMAFISSGPWQSDQFQAMKQLLVMQDIQAGVIRRPWFTQPFSSDQNRELQDSLNALQTLAS